MDREALKALLLLSMGMVGALLQSGAAFAQQEPAVNRGVAFVKRSLNRGAGESAMIALGLMKAEVPSSDPVVQRCLAQIRARVNYEGVYAPEMGPGPGTYEAGVSIMALATEDAVQNRTL